MRPLLAVLLTIAIGAGPQSASAASPTAAESTLQADSLYFAGRPTDVLALCETVFASGTDDAGLRWRAARAAIAEGMRHADRRERLAWYDRALAHARRAYELAPGDLETRYWVAAAAGRRADKDDPMYSARLALEVYNHSTAILVADSLHAGAHHAMGMLHSEVLRVPRFVRFLAGRVLRVNLVSRANWSDAERHLRRATELEPTMIQYLVDLAALYGRASRNTEANVVLDQLAAAPARHPMDALIRDACVARWRASPRAAL